MTQQLVQIIDDQLQYQPKLESYIQESQIARWEKNYKVVAIIGCQSSGKSI